MEEAWEGIAESQLDEMWNYVGKKANQRWLWHAVARLTGQVLAYTFGSAKKRSLSQAQKVVGAIW